MGIVEFKHGVWPRIILAAFLLALNLIASFQSRAAELPQAFALYSPKASSAAKPTGAFSSIPIPIKTLPISTSWNGVFPAIRQARFSRCQEGTRCTPSARYLAQVVRSSGALPLSQKLASINREINQLIAYRSDMENYGVLDFWASPNQILTLGSGDCEDYVILKMAALAESGVPTKSMSMVVLLDTRREVFHAVLSVATSNGNYILDNLNNEVLLDDKIRHYLPLYSMSEDRYWLHGRTHNGDTVAADYLEPSLSMPGVEVAKKSPATH